MTKSTLHQLNFDLTYKYVQQNLINTNTLSSILIKLVNFKNGIFFTFLPNNVSAEDTHKFRESGIAKEVKDQIESFIINKLHSCKKLACIFDDVSSTFSPEYDEPLFLFCGLIQQKEIYYFVPQKNVSSQLINQCFYVSDSIWHSLCVLFENNFENKIEKQISLEDFEEICKGVKLIIVGAYDGEGYIIWEKHQ